MALKRTLRRRAAGALDRAALRCASLGGAVSSVMVNAALPCTTAGPPRRAAFAQILGKFYFVDLRENFRRILVDYEPNCPRPANAAFSRA
jgi:hypothetical protein